MQFKYEVLPSLNLLPLVLLSLSLGLPQQFLAFLLVFLVLSSLLFVEAFQFFDVSLQEFLVVAIHVQDFKVSRVEL